MRFKAKRQNKDDLTKVKRTSNQTHAILLDAVNTVRILSESDYIDIRLLSQIPFIAIRSIVRQLAIQAVVLPGCGSHLFLLLRELLC
jgi:hypothetical protein